MFVGLQVVNGGVALMGRAQRRRAEWLEGAGRSSYLKTKAISLNLNLHANW